MYRRKIAYLFSYRNGIRERSVGILRQYGDGKAVEVVLELLRAPERETAWRIYYFNRRECLAEASVLKETSVADPRHEMPVGVYRLCAEAGNGVLLLPETVAASRNSGLEWPETDSYLCGRFDGAEIKPEQVQRSFSYSGGGSTYNGECMQSAKRLVEEITRVAAGENGKATEAAVNVQEGQPEEAECRKLQIRKRAEQNRIACLEELLLAKPSYRPCREASLLHSVRVLPEELRHLPREGRQFAENSFLLHGYYHYQHLLLGRRRKKEQDDYVLLVPGVYRKKNAYLAELFGFPEFLPAKTEESSGKELFGYWCAKI